MLTLNDILKEYLELDDECIKEVINTLKDGWLQYLDEGIRENKPIKGLVEAIMGR